ncbi:MAG: MBL fold metallo-hydrolase [Bacteroidetes bacterium]|nr:MBL fold metallo-hydrolase [Bacteroidota bacterium]
MKIEQIYTGCLAQGAYFIQSENEAVVIDPLREVQPYLDRAEKEGVKIKYVFETHFHADFVSGHVDLANATGASIVFGPNAKTNFTSHVATDGEEFKVGKLRFKVLHTPGHTMESTCYLLMDENGKEVALFTGDTLFIGDVGRPDLAQKSDVTQDDLAGMLFDSLRNKVMTLPNDVLVYPAHGAGSACGKNMSKETYDTLAHQKEVNYALRANMTKAEFIKEVTDGLMPPPAYFPQNVMMNKEGYESISNVMKRSNQGLSPEAFETAANETGALLLDTRDPQLFAKAFVPNSINIGIDGGFAPWVGALIPDVKQELLIIADEGREEEVVTRLARVGYDNALGFLAGGIEAWKKAGKEIDSITSISADELAEVISKNEKAKVVDVRKHGEYVSEHINGVTHAPLDFVNDAMPAISKDEPVYIHCAGGYRSMIFTSILRARGYNNLIDIKGGYNAIKSTGKFDLTDYVCPSTLTK